MRLADWPGYSPRACDRDDGFPADRAVVYTFRLVAPLAAGLVTNKQLVTLERQLQQQEREGCRQRQQGVQGLALSGVALAVDEGREVLGGLRGASATEEESAVAAVKKGKAKKAKNVAGSLRGLSQGLGIK
jgi:hypothetical protein